jgi:hypothetical protein
MARVHGKNAYLEIDGVDLSSFCDSASLGDTTDVAETTGFGSEAKTYIAGLDDATLSISGRWDSQASEVQQVAAEGTVSDGTYTITFDGQETSALDHDASTGTITTALNNLSNVASGDIVVGGVGLPGTPVTLTFAQAYLGVDVPLVEIDSSSLTGGGEYVASVLLLVGPNATLTAVKAGKVAVPYVFGPEGKGSGKVRYSGNAVLTAYNVSAPVGDVVAFTAEFQVTGGNTPDTFD